MKNLTRQQFEEITKHGSIRKPTGQTPAGEDLCETALEFGLVNGYSLADICHFYAHMQRRWNEHRDEKLADSEMLDTAYEHFVHDAVQFAGTIIDAAPKVVERAAINQATAKKKKAATSRNRRVQTSTQSSKAASTSLRSKPSSARR